MANHPKKTTYRWATPGCGIIANELAQALQKDGRNLYVAANITYENYEVLDMEKAVSGEQNEMCSDYTADVMSIITQLRKDRGLVYPEKK